VSGSSDGNGVSGPYFGGFSGGNAQERTNFDRRPEVLLRRPEYSCG